jgi:hypothetical protein
MLRKDSSVLRIDDPTDNIAIKQIIVKFEFSFSFFFSFFFSQDRIVYAGFLRWG